MAYTYAVQGIGSSLTDSVNNLELIDPSLWAHVDTQVLDNGGRESVYQRNDGEVEYPTTLRIGVYPKEGTPATFNVSFRQSGFVKQLDGTDVLDVQPYSVVYAWTMPWAPVPDLADVFELVQNVFSWIIPDVVSGALDDAFVTNLQYSLTELDLSGVTRT